MRRLVMAVIVGVLLAAPVARADGAWGTDPPLLDCGRLATQDRTLKVYATDLAGAQVIRYYLHVTWCYRRASGAVTRTAATAWGETSAKGSWSYARNIEGPVIAGNLVWVRGEFEYVWPPILIRAPAGSAYPFIRVVQLGGPHYSCVAGIVGGKFGQRVSKCVVAVGGVR